MVRTHVCKMFESLGYHVLAAESVDRCIELENKYQGRVNLLLTDVVMPGMNGRDLFERLHTREGP